MTDCRQPALGISSAASIVDPADIGVASRDAAVRRDAVAVLDRRAPRLGLGYRRIVAVVVERLVPGWWFIMAGSIVGAIAGGYIDEQANEL